MIRIGRGIPDPDPLARAYDMGLGEPPDLPPAPRASRFWWVAAGITILVGLVLLV